jgi:hypothetical protein
MLKHPNKDRHKVARFFYFQALRGNTLTRESWYTGLTKLLREYRSERVCNSPSSPAIGPSDRFPFFHPTERVNCFGSASDDDAKEQGMSNTARYYAMLERGQSFVCFKTSMKKYFAHFQFDTKLQLFTVHCWAVGARESQIKIRQYRADELSRVMKGSSSILYDTEHSGFSVVFAVHKDKQKKEQRRATKTLTKQKKKIYHVACASPRECQRWVAALYVIKETHGNVSQPYNVVKSSAASLRDTDLKWHGKLEDIMEVYEKIGSGAFANVHRAKLKVRVSVCVCVCVHCVGVYVCECDHRHLTLCMCYVCYICTCFRYRLLTWWSP